MPLLLDTHVLLWALTEDRRLRPEVRDQIADGRTRVLVSAASAWEITIKRALGKLRAPGDLSDQLAAARFEGLALTTEHALAVGDLPALHGDPFDRLLVAQARVEGLTLVTSDPQVQRYEVTVLPV
ncbi:type II toxin-antitoxin system VapC family toxin [soil metagenome]